MSNNIEKENTDKAAIKQDLIRRNGIKVNLENRLLR